MSALIRASADRRSGWAPAVSPVDELGGEEQGDGEADLGKAVPDGSVGVAAELPEVRQPRVGALDRPPQAERNDLLVAPPGRGSSADLGADQLDTEARHEPADDGVVVAAVEMQRLALGEHAAGIGSGEGGFE
jgi:hypothetical protein